MQTEIEAKFLDVSHDEVRAKLKNVGAECTQPMRLMRRSVFDFPNKHLAQKGGWARVRDEGDRFTMSYKQLNNRTVDGTKEINLTIDSYESGVDFLKSLGLVQKAYQETKRESWTLDKSEIELDEWPWIKPFVEVESPTEHDLKTVSKMLGLDYDNAVHGSVEIVYNQVYDVPESEVVLWPEIMFTDVPAWLEGKRRA